MHKLRLRLEDLAIDSFATTYVKREKGTVYGEQCTCPTACTCPGCPTCDASCNGSCGGVSCINTCVQSCYGTCDATCGSTCDYTCGGDTCDPTCAGWATLHGPQVMCVECA